VPNNQTAKAKINLCLHVTGQRADGYHLLDSLVVFADFGDALKFTIADEFALSIDGPFGGGLGAGPENLINRAATFLGGGGAHVRLTKNLPISSGIGGGSADAAAALRGLSDLWNVALPDDRGLSLGADVPVCLRACATRMQGIGEQLADVDFLPAIAAVLVNSGDAVSTPTIFASLKSKTNPEISFLPNDPLSFSNAVTYLGQLRNDLEQPAISNAPAIGQVLHALSETGAGLARMSGSGATCFGLFADFTQAKDAALVLAENHPKWWVQPVMLNARD
jgi:4-diphosphocytidyl-2-C-methyl-D-erythritol kinase